MRSRRSNTWFLLAETISKAESLHVEGRGMAQRGSWWKPPSRRPGRARPNPSFLTDHANIPIAAGEGSVVCLEFIISFDGVLAMMNRKAWEG
ncbi:hypothetical protein R1flu_015795 [Riccia fluitans]|uniref:Uncharacterized protein n=1 Tax=Riccia fluitans TaxID=41844 RepID=A0ABD1YL06_9MARC